MMINRYTSKENDELEKQKEGQQPQEALFLVLAYLPLYELLCMSRVCRSLREAVNSDVLPWLNLLVDKPLDSRLSDDHLMKVTSMADGRLSSLALVNCFKITDDGLLRVVLRNPRINKLHIPGCTRITAEGVIKAVQLLTKNKNHRLKSLKISGIYNIKKEHMATLCSLLGKNHENLKKHKNFYHKRRTPLTKIGEDEDPSIDIDVCPKCGETRQIFDCPRKDCCCRGCIFCLRRCEECGVCIKDEEEESAAAACSDDLCLNCWLQLPKCSFCNRPYCLHHENRQCKLPGSGGFLCVACNDNFVQNSYR